MEDWKMEDWKIEDFKSLKNKNYQVYVKNRNIRARFHGVYMIWYWNYQVTDENNKIRVKFICKTRVKRAKLPSIRE